MRYYYKKDNSYYNLLEPTEIEGAVEITEEEFTAHQQSLYPTVNREKLNRIHNLKEQLERYKQDVEQVELFGMARDDYEQKKALCIEIIEELRTLERR